MKKYLSIAISISLILVIGYILIWKEKSTLSPPEVSPSGVATNNSPTSANVIVKDGIQYITVNAKGGYFPKNSVARAWMPTKLVVKTEGTYDCSSSLVIRSLNYEGTLPATGETALDIASKAPGEKLQASCGMWMYNFNVEFR